MPLFALDKVLCLPSVFVLHLANKFFSSSCPPNFSCSPHTLRGTRCSNLIYFSICLLFLINLFLLKVFSLISQIWTASESNNRIFLVEKWYSWYWVHCEALTMKLKKIRTFCSQYMTTNGGWIVFKFCKMQTKYENYEICQEVKISYMEAVVNSWQGFAQFFMYDPYKPKHLRRSFIELRRIRLDFEAKWNLNLGLTS